MQAAAEIWIARPGDAARLDHLHADVFDGPLRADWLASYLADPRLHLALAAAPDGLVIGMASAVHYHHPDKPPDLWINELGVAAPWRRRGIATDLLGALAAHGRGLGCRTAWVLADPTPEALGFYRSLDWDQTGTHLAMFARDLTDPPR